MIKRGDLEAHRIGKHLRISENQLDFYLLKARGATNVYDGVIESFQDQVVATVGSVRILVNTVLDGAVKLVIRPEDIILSKGLFTSSARNMHQGTVKDIQVEGAKVIVVMDIGIPISVLITEASYRAMAIKEGDTLYAIFKTMSVRVYKP